MPDDQIIFNPDQKDYNAGRRLESKAPQGLVGWLINHSGGLIKNVKLANIVLALVAFACLFAAVVILINTFGQ